MMKSIETDPEFAEMCRRISWKCTSQRMAVYEFLKGNLDHPDVDTVWAAVRESLPTISRESVYRILNEFAEKEIIRRLNHIDNARYDSRTDAHGHFICTKCGKIMDFDWPKGVAIPNGTQSGKVIHKELRLVGFCNECAEK